MITQVLVSADTCEGSMVAFRSEYCTKELISLKGLSFDWKLYTSWHEITCCPKRAQSTMETGLYCIHTSWCVVMLVTILHRVGAINAG